MSVRLRNIAVFVALLLFAREGLDGAARYYLAGYGLPYLIYIPTVLMVLYVVIRFLSDQSREPRLISLVLVVLFLASGIIGFLNSGNLKQTLFALYVFVPFLFGYQTGDLLFKSKLVKMAFVGFVILFAFGVLYEVGRELPWKGFSYEVGGVELQGSRLWGSVGLNRYSGFGRYSFAIASLLMTFLIVLYQRIHPKLYFLLFVIGGVAVVLTTTKAAILALLLLLVLIAFIKPLSALFYHLSIKLGLILTFVIGTALPVSTLWVTYNLNLDNFVMRVVFLSFDMRLNIVWPKGMETFQHLGDFLLGRGAGQMGVAQMIYDSGNYHPGDNMYLYVLVVLGLPFLLLLFFLLYRLFKLNGTRGYVNYLFMALFIFVYGVFANVMESAVLSYFLGSLIAVAFREKHTKKAP